MLKETHHIELVHRLTRYMEERRPRRDLSMKYPLVGIEIGVDRGDLSESLLRCLPGLMLHMVDPWTAYEPDSHYRSTGDVRSKRNSRKWLKVFRQVVKRTKFAENRIHIHKATSEDVAKNGPIEEKSLDFVFIDGDHSFEGCLDDIRLWLPYVKKDGIIGGHDWDNPRCGRIRDGVERAVKKVCEEDGREYELGVGLTWFFKGPHHD